MNKTLLFLLLLVMQPALAGNLYRWVDDAGKVHYGDTPANDARKVQEKKFDAPATPVSGDDALSFEMRRAKQRFPVTLYVADNCKEACQQARDFLKKRDIPFAEKDLKTKEDIAAFKKESGSNTVPTLSVGTNWLKGFLAQDWQDELDAAGYPKQH